MNGSQDTTQKRKTAERRTQRRGYFLPGDSMKSELEEVRDLLQPQLALVNYSEGIRRSWAQATIR